MGSWCLGRTLPDAANRLIEWNVSNDLLVKAYEGLRETGRPPYPPVVLLKMLVIACIYRLSGRQMEEMTSYHLAVKEFVCLWVTERAPDHSTLSDFRTHAKEAAGWDLFQAISDEVVRQCREPGIVLGKIRAVDGVHDVAVFGQ